MIISSGKRFMAYEIIKRLKQQNDTATLQLLSTMPTRKRKEERTSYSKVFTNSFDAKAIFSDKFLLQKLNYIHHNPVSEVATGK
jgi:hypothetical protein